MFKVFFFFDSTTHLEVVFVAKHEAKENSYA